MSEAAQRIAENEVVLREVNERIAEKTSDLEARGLAGSDETSQYLCSCGRPDCDESLNLTLAEFEAAHARDDQFVVAPGHEVPDVDELVAELRRLRGRAEEAGLQATPARRLTFTPSGAAEITSPWPPRPSTIGRTPVARFRVDGRRASLRARPVWIAAAAAAVIWLPGLSESQGGALSSLVANDSPAIRAEARAQAALPRAAHCRHDGGAARSLWSVGRRAGGTSFAARSASTSGAIAICSASISPSRSSTRSGSCPGRGRARRPPSRTCTSTALGFSTKRTLAESFVQRHIPPSAHVVGVTGAGPARTRRRTRSRTPSSGSRSRRRC